MRPLGMGVKNMGNRRVRNRQLEIKRMMEQPRNIKVKQNGRAVCRMVVRSRRSILVNSEETTIKYKH